ALQRELDDVPTDEAGPAEHEQPHDAILAARAFRSAAGYVAHVATNIDAQAGDRVAGGDEWGNELYRIAANQFDRAGALLELDPEFVTRLREPRRSLVVNFPVRLDSG
ncbi:MAG TPA: hypothetical protein VGV90_15025, partial [Solirubrobacteraceae bacterium]|nr:hypothetical protein [Solirubrobacteraceae bacterium]